MSYSLATGFTPLISAEPVEYAKVRSCADARKACMPPFVFSIAGQVGFRQALHHLIHCRRHTCRTLRRMVLEGMRHKLHWLFEETVLLGCIQVQPHLYGQNKVTLRRQNFSAVASHLAHCPKESCAQLRRAILLDIRNQVSPNAQV